MSVPYPYELATPEQLAPGSPWWCWNHDRQLGIALIPVAERVREILEFKPECERETRLQALRPVIGPLPEKLRQADAALQPAHAASRQAYVSWQQVDAASQQALAVSRQPLAMWQQAEAASQQGYAATRQADAALQQAHAARQQALLDHAAEIDALFGVECADVPWGPGGLIFPNEEPRETP